MDIEWPFEGLQFLELPRCLHFTATEVAIWTKPVGHGHEMSFRMSLVFPIFDLKLPNR